MENDHKETQRGKTTCAKIQKTATKKKVCSSASASCSSCRRDGASLTRAFPIPNNYAQLVHFSIFPLCHLSPLTVSCNISEGLCKRWGRSQRISSYLTLACPSSSSYSLIYHTQTHLSPCTPLLLV